MTPYLYQIFSPHFLSPPSRWHHQKSALYSLETASDILPYTFLCFLATALHWFSLLLHRVHVVDLIQRLCIVGERKGMRWWKRLFLLIFFLLSHLCNSLILSLLCREWHRSLISRTFRSVDFDASQARRCLSSSPLCSSWPSFRVSYHWLFRRFLFFQFL